MVEIQTKFVKQEERFERISGALKQATQDQKTADDIERQAHKIAIEGSKKIDNQYNQLDNIIKVGHEADDITRKGAVELRRQRDDVERAINTNNKI